MNIKIRKRDGRLVKFNAEKSPMPSPKQALPRMSLILKKRVN